MPQPEVYDVSSFCESHKISRSFLYKLIAEGHGPRLLKLGRRTLISSEAATEWRARMEKDGSGDPEICRSYGPLGHDGSTPDPFPSPPIDRASAQRDASLSARREGQS
jgi:hypothetical protein